jgi:ribose-phosphate pyrophosphokinase
MKLSVIGFKDEATLVRGVAKVLKVNPQFVTVKKYHAGEWTVFNRAKIGRRTIVVGSVWEDPAKIFRLTLLLHAVKEAGAKKVVLLAPWIAYGRQDRPAKPGETAAGEVVAQTLLANGVDEIVTLDAHGDRFKKFFRGKLVNIYPVATVVEHAKKLKATAIAAPDKGAVGRAQLVAKKLRVSVIVVEKRRIGPGRVKSKLLSGKPKGKRILIVDDMADSGGTLKEAKKILLKNGALSVNFFVTHAINGSIDSAFDHRTKNLDRQALTEIASRGSQ